MLTDTNPNITAPIDAVPSDRNVREIVAVCAKHNIPCGEPEHFAKFMRALYDDKHFAMDFWRVVARVTKNAGDTIRPDRLLTIVVEGVTGKTVAQIRATGPAEASLVAKLTRVLAGEDDLSAPIATVAPEPVREPNPFFSPPEERPRLRLDPDFSASLPHAANPEGHASPPHDDPQIVIPLAAYADREREGRLSAGKLVAVLVLLLIAAGGFWFGYHRNSAAWQKLSASARTGYASASSLWQRALADQPPANAPQVSSPASSANPLAAPEQLPTLPPTSSPAAQSSPALAQPAQSEPPHTEPAQTSPVQTQLPPSKSSDSATAQTQPAQSNAAVRTAAKPRHTIDPVVLEAARESQQP